MEPFVFTATPMMPSPGVLLVCVVAVLAALYPVDAHLFARFLETRVGLMVLNFRMRRMQRKLYRELAATCKEAGWPAPPPFKFVPIQERKG